MGENVEVREFTREDRIRYRARLRRCVEALRLLLAQGRFDEECGVAGLEIELHLVDGVGQPAMVSEEVLRRIASRDFQEELGRFNIEVNVAPRRLSDGVFGDLEEELRTALAYADRQAGAAGARTVMIGTLPTLTGADMAVENMSPQGRYALLNEAIVSAREDDVRLDIEGAERLRGRYPTILPEACCTSVQCHVQVPPEWFAAYHNAAQAVAGVQVAVAANSPFLFGRELWRETRPVLLEQAIDTRPAEFAAQGVRPRAWFGERWVGSVVEVFEENARYFPALLPVVGDEDDPVEVVAAGGVPGLTEMRLHNGTVYRWNRPVYDVADGFAHVRVENRVLPSGPTVVDVVANAAFFYGVVRALAEADPPVWSVLPFEVARSNFEAGARWGLEAELFWPGVGVAPVAGLVEEVFLPLAEEGLAAWGVEASARARLLGVVGDRCARGVNGAVWQAAAFRRGWDGSEAGRGAALAGMVRRYVELAGSGEPVHTWPVA